MTVFDSQAVIERACTTKASYRSAGDARRAARESDTPVKAYRCPFPGSRRRRAHWHVGPVLSLVELEEIARAIREASV